MTVPIGIVSLSDDILHKDLSTSADGAIVMLQVSSKVADGAHQLDNGSVAAGGEVARGGRTDNPGLGRT